jgi:hypothetical protein
MLICSMFGNWLLKNLERKKQPEFRTWKMCEKSVIFWMAGKLQFWRIDYFLIKCDWREVLSMNWPYPKKSSFPKYCYDSFPIFKFHLMDVKYFIQFYFLGDLNFINHTKIRWVSDLVENIEIKMMNGKVERSKTNTMQFSN